MNFPSAELKFIFMHLGQYSMNFLNCLFIPKQSTQVIPLIAACKVWDRLKWFEVSKSWFLRINILWLFSNILFMKMVSLLDTTGIYKDPSTLSIAVLSYLVQRSTIPLIVVVFSFAFDKAKKCKFRRVGFSSCSLSS